jgi:ASC-1-like (ASCH) protein
MSKAKTYTKSIDNKKLPWLDWIRDGKKTFEGRLCLGDWQSITCGDIIIFDCGDYKLATRVIGKKLFGNFSEAYDSLGNKLVPDEAFSANTNLSIQVVKFYSQYFTDDEIATCGVCAVELAHYKIE